MKSIAHIMDGYDTQSVDEQGTSYYDEETVASMIKEAMEEAIDHCAEEAETETMVYYNQDGGYEYNVVDRVKIRALKSQIK